MPTAVYHHAPGWVIMISPGSQLRRPKQEKRKCFRVETATVSSHQSKGLARQYERLNRQKKIQWPSAYDSPSVWKGLEKLTNYKPNATQSTNRSPTTWTAFSVTDKQWKSYLPTPPTPIQEMDYLLLGARIWRCDIYHSTGETIRYIVILKTRLYLWYFKTEFNCRN